ncbi:MAG: acetylornithine deacetylase, partial [Rhodobacterales bacterium]|nr:acetylornithine deacetylase [Rhodobacterales bacterium]
ELVAWVEAYLDGYGISATRVYDPTGRKAALYANVGPEVEGGVVLSGHTDVVPVDGQAWDTDPWVVTERGSRLYGRGTCDMKGFDALALSAVPLALERGVKRPLQIALSYDEEVGCVGAPPMIDEMVKHLPRAAAAIIGEPSMMKAVSAHKGGIGFHTHLRGFEVHSSLIHTGVSAIMFGAKLIEWANQTNAANAAATPGALAGAFVPPYTTLHVGQISGGTAHNITAKDCRFGMDFRVVPGESMADWKRRFLDKVAQIEAEMQAINPDTGIDVTPYFTVTPLAPEENGVAEGLARAITGDNGRHVVSYGTEAGQFQERGYSAVVCGPGDIAQAHQPNEYIEKAQFAAGEAFVARVVDSLCA